MAYSLNKSMIIGNLTRDPESRSTPNGQNVCNFSVATSMSWTDTAGVKQERPEYHNVVAWGKLADICTQYLTKGRKVYVEGRLQTRDWQGTDGVKKYRTEIVADSMIILDKAGGGGSARTPGTPAGMAPQAMGDVPPIATPPTDEIRVEDIPF